MWRNVKFANFAIPIGWFSRGQDREVAQRILLKMKVTEKPVYLLQPQQVDELEKDLWDLRSKTLR